MAISHGREKNSSAKAVSGSHPGAASRRFSWARRMMTCAAALAALMVLMPVAAEAQSALDGFDPGANASVLAMAVQADGKILVGGDFTTLGGGGTGTTPRNRIGRLNPDGSLDTSFNPGASSSVFALAVQADGKILVGGSFTKLGGGGTGVTTRNYIGRLNSDGSLDTSFDPGADGSVFALALQEGGEILVGGTFSTLGGGGTGTSARNRIGRLSANGSLDTSFDPGANGPVLALGVLVDGQILVGGTFTKLGGGGTGTVTRNNIGRLDADGSLDTSFDPGATTTVEAFAVQADGKILVGGWFTKLGGGGTGTTTRNYIGRLHADGSLDTSFNPGASGNVYALAVQADGRILVGGIFTALGGGGTGTTTRYRIGRLYSNGSLDTGFDPGTNNDVHALRVQADGKILIGGLFTTLGGGDEGTTARNRIGRLYADGGLDAGFDPGANSSINTVYALAVQPDGKILVGGDFTTLGSGGTETAARNRIGRINPDGSLDSSFDPGANNIVYAVAVQADGKILVGGDFTTLGGGGTGTSTRNHVGRLNADGSLDTSFNPGADGAVLALAVQADGKILIGGNFTKLGGGTGTTARSRIGRLNADGSLDTGFNPGADGAVIAFAVQADSRILLGGLFTKLGGGGTGTTLRNKIGRLDATGSVDTGFNPGADAQVNAIALQADGRIVVGGYFSTLGGGGAGTTPRNQIGRLMSDGTLDASFDPGANFPVITLAMQADGKILAGGYFTTLGGGGTGITTRNFIGRLLANGSLDTSFNPGANDYVDALAVQADGKILVGGDFTTLGSGGTGTTARNRIGRLTNADAALLNFTVNAKGITIDWDRSNASPEVNRVTFELSTDNVTYTPLGSATRVTGGWQLAVPCLPRGRNLSIRARGFHSSGYFNGSGSIVESVHNVYVSPHDWLLVDFGSSKGLFSYNDPCWTLLSEWDPVQVVEWEGGLAIDFGPGRGLFNYSGGTWAYLTGWIPESMIRWGSILVADFGAGKGLFQYNGTTWTQLSGWNPSLMVEWAGGLAIDFGAGLGLYNYNGSSWKYLTGWNPESMLEWGSDLVLDFGAGKGLFAYNGTAWTTLTAWNAERVVVWTGGLAVDFGPGYGLYVYNGGAWTLLTGWDPEMMIKWGTNLVIDFGAGRGLFYYNGTYWTMLSEWNPENVIEWAGTMAVDFGAGRGLFTFDGAFWTLLTGWDPQVFLATAPN